MASHRITTKERTKLLALKRNKMKRFVIKSLAIALVMLAAFLQQVLAQDTLPQLLTHEAFIDIVRNHHPMARAAQLKGQEGEFLIQSAKGGFDPKLAGNIQQKYFDGTNYYSYVHGGLKIPTWFGVTLQAGYDANTGARLNPEAYTSDAGLWNAGISVQLGNGLLIDQRRADLRQAEIYANSTELEQKLMLNQLELDASMAYYDWFKAYNYYRVFETAVENASLRLDNIRQAALFGDKASIDTLKALIFLQERQLNLERTRLNLQNKQAQLEIFLWQDGSIPLELAAETIPPNYLDFSPSVPPILASETIDTLALQHPDYLISSNKLAISKIDYRLKREALKPSLELKYNALSSDKNNALFDDYSISNYAWGASISYPIFTRKERAAVQLTELKMEQQAAQLDFKNAELRYKIEQSFNTWTSTLSQLDIYQQSVTNYSDLLQSEITLFEIGEGSLFLVNLRDQEYIDSQLKLIEIMVQNNLGEVWYDYSTVGN